MTYREILETLDSALAQAIDSLEELQSEYDIGDSEELMGDAEDMIDSLEEIRGVINA